MKTAIDLNNLVVQYQQEENETKKDDLFNQIYSHYKTKFNNIAFKMHNEDISQELCIALLNAIATFKVDLNVKFNTYFWKIAQNHLGVLNYHKKATKREPVLPLLYLDQPIIDSNTFDIVTLGDLIEDEAAVQQFSDLNLSLFLEQEIFTHLSTLHVQIIKLYLLGYTMLEISQVLNISTSTIQNKMRNIKSNKNICSKLANYLDRYDLLSSKKQSHVVYSVEWVQKMIKDKIEYKQGAEN